MKSSPPLAGPLPWLLAWRFLGGSRSRLLHSTARSALLSIALGVTAMVVAMALMSGYRHDLQRKLATGNAAVVAYPLGGKEREETPALLEALRSIPGVREVRRVSYGQGSLAGPDVAGATEVTLRGVDPGASGLPGAASWELGPDAAGLPGAILGRELARKLAASPGQVLRLMVLGFGEEGPRFRYRSLRVVDAFTTGFAEFDASWVMVDRAFLERLLGRERGPHLYELTAEDLSAAPRIARRAAEILGEDFLVTDWQDLNRPLFTALKLQQIALFLVLGLVVLVSTFNVASTLVVLVRERMRDVGVLAAMGLSPRRLRMAFLLYGGLLGTVGTLAGVGGGWGTAWVMTTFELIRFEPEVAAIYFISSVPFRVEAGDLVAVITFTLGVTLLACWLPARRAAGVDPSNALRYE